VRRDADFFTGQDPALIYIARRLSEAKRLESVLTDAGVDYGVEADTYKGGVIFQSERIGAFFYVLPDSAAAARALMQQHGFRPHEEGR